MELSLILLIAQISSSITVLAGLVAIILTIQAASGLLSSKFKSVLWYSALFLIITLIGITAMTFYHFSYGTEMGETLELVWYIFTFASLLFSLFESYQEIEFGKTFLSIKEFGKKKK